MKNMLKSVLAVAAMAVAGLASAVPVSGQGTWETTLQSRDIDGNGVVDAYYDTSLNISWLANANSYADNTTGGTWAGGMTHSDAVAWTSALDVAGVTGWRLPEMINSSVEGWQVNPNSSELAHMYFTTLGNEGAPNDSHGDISLLSNTGPFASLLANPQWMGNSYGASDSGEALYWGFSMFYGYQGFYAEQFRGIRTWAVHDGDVGSVAAVTAPVPEPETYALMLAGLGAIGVMRRRRKF